MKLDSYKELFPVVYGETSIKILKFTKKKANEICFTPHWHNRIEFIRVIKGGLKLLIKDEYITLKSGELAIICPCQLHEGISISDDTAYNVLMFDIEDFYNSTAVSKNFLRPIADSTITFDYFTADCEIISVFDILTNQNKASDIISPLQIHGYLFNLLGLLYKKCNPEEKTQNHSDEKFNLVIDYINNNFTDKITTSILSSKFGYDEAYFCRRFKKNTGISAMKYINILRLEKAQHLLKKTDNEISIIAPLCGFSDTSYFAQSFHSHYGMSPSEFRKTHK